MGEIEEDYIKRLTDKDKDTKSWESNYNTVQKQFRDLDS